MTYDESPCSPRSVAYDYGRTIRRSVEGAEADEEDPRDARIAELEGALRSIQGHIEECVGKRHDVNGLLRELLAISKRAQETAVQP